MRTSRQLINAVFMQQPEQVEFLLKRKVKADHRDPEHGETALMLAVQQHSKQIVDLLIEYGADVNAKDFISGRSSCFYASHFHLPRLIAAGADINHVDKHGMSALMYAAEAEHNNKIALLVQLGADTMIKDQYGMTARDYIIEYIVEIISDI